MAKELTEQEREETKARIRDLEDESSNLESDLALRNQEKAAKEKNSKVRKDLDDLDLEEGGG